MDRRYCSLGLAGAIFVGLITVHQATAGPFSFFSGSKPASKGIQWHRDLKEAHRVAASSHRPLLIVFGGKSCAHCRRLERETLSEAEVVKYVESNFVPVHLDYDKDRKVAEVLEVTHLPCTVVLSSDADLLGNVVGYVDSKELKISLDKALRTEKQLRSSVTQTAATSSRGTKTR